MMARSCANCSSGEFYPNLPTLKVWCMLLSQWKEEKERCNAHKLRDPRDLREAIAFARAGLLEETDADRSGT